MADAPIPFAVPHIIDEEIAAVERVLRSGWLTTGAECLALEVELAEYLEVPHAVALSSCTAALETAYAYLGLPAGARVGVPTWTFVASALAPAKHGAIPVLLDVEPDTLNVSPESLEAALDEGLDAVVAVHFGGSAVSKEIHDLCAERRVPLVEDAAHALGARDHRGMVAGQNTVGACFSFYATKNLTSGEGGALVTADRELADFARVFRLHGLSRDAWKRYEPGSDAAYELELPGIKANLPDILAAVARVQLARFDEMQASRRKAVERYHANLAGTPLCTVPSDDNEDSADHLFVALLPEGVNRCEVVAHLARADIGTSVHFSPLHTFGWFKENAAIAPGGLAAADAAAPRAISMPLHSQMTPQLVDRVCDVLVDAIRR